MRRISVLGLVLSSGAVFAEPADWLDISYGNTRADLPQREQESGTTLGVSAAFSVQGGFYLRADLLRDRLDYFQPIGPLDGPEHGEDRRELRAMSAGYAVPLFADVDLTFDLGVAQIERVIVAPSLGGQRYPIKETTPLIRLGMNGAWNRYSLHAGVTYLDSEPDVYWHPDEELHGSTLWWDIRAGYQLNDRWNLGVRHLDSEDFTSTSASLRWRW